MFMRRKNIPNVVEKLPSLCVPLKYVTMCLRVRQLEHVVRPIRTLAVNYSGSIFMEEIKSYGNMLNFSLNNIKGACFP